MGQIIVRNLDDDVIVRLKARAVADEKSLEQAVRDILTQAAQPSKAEVLAELDRLRSLSRYVPGLDSTKFIREWRDRDPFRR